MGLTLAQDRFGTDCHDRSFKLLLEVRFPDGSTAELREKVNLTDIGPVMVKAGDILPVRYDPDDHSAVVIGDAGDVRREAADA
jgi:hypothetical protein